jgi:hypothetical protein
MIKFERTSLEERHFNTKDFQFILWDSFKGFRVLGKYPSNSKYVIYSWRLVLGFLEIRKWG